MLVASIRLKGRYQDVGKIYGKLFKLCGKHLNGAPSTMYHDLEYKEEDADIEACVPVKKEISEGGIGCRLLKGRSGPQPKNCLI